MFEDIKRFYNNNRPWIYMAENIAVGFFLVVIVVLINLQILPGLDTMPEFFLTNSSLAESILSTLAGAWLTITTFTFSITMVVLTTYSTNYSPRVVENFLHEKTSMKVLGTFVGGFVYCISTLFFLGETFINDRVLSASVAILYAFWCIIRFIIFIFSVANSVQAPNLITGLYEDAREIIDKFIEEHNTLRLDKVETQGYPQEMAIPAQDSGYLVAVEIDKLKKVLEGKDCRLVVLPRLGDFISKGQTLAICYTMKERQDWSKEKEQVVKSFSLSSKRYMALDYRYAAQKIVDIALRAISTGINDPNTAISCIHSLSLLTGRLSAIEGSYELIPAEEGSSSEIILENYNFKADLYTTYSQIIYYGKADISVILALLDAVAGAVLVSSSRNLEPLRELAIYISDTAFDQFTHPMDVMCIKTRMQKIFRAA